MHHRNRGTWRSKSRLLKFAAVTGAATLIAMPVAATHSWGGYHWARTSAQISPPVGDNVSAAWDGYLQTAVADWNRSKVIESPLTSGGTTPRTCKPVAGTIQACNEAYGRNGWLGIATIWLSNGHISQATTKVNDSYFNMPQYNNAAEKASVMCQELGHDYGLDHQDENFSTDSTNSCMDYTNNPEGNEHPDRHDYDQLVAIYNHFDSAQTANAVRSMPSQAAIGNTPADWGSPVRRNSRGQPNVFVRDLGNGNKALTHVFWAKER